MKRRDVATRNTSQVLMLQDELPASEAKDRLREEIEVQCLTAQTEPLADVFERRIIGQEPALEALTCAFPRVLAGLRDPSRPALSVLLLGPTGVGKTETAKALALTLFGSENALTRVNSEEYAHSHELAKLLGSPPGYVGHDIEPLLSRRRIERHHRVALAEREGMVGRGDGRIAEVFPADKENYLSVVLFDEIEKAHPVLWNALLGILEGGVLTLGNNETTDFTRSIIVMTSNVGSRDMGALLRRRRRPGFGALETPTTPRAEGLKRAALDAARVKFPLEFLNRFDDILVYSALEREHLGRIFDKFLADIHMRAIHQAGVPLLIKVSPEAKELILDRGEDVLFGARPLRRAMETEIVDPLSRSIASAQIKAGDVVEIEKRGHALVFFRRRHDDASFVA